MRPGHRSSRLCLLLVLLSVLVTLDTAWAEPGESTIVTLRSADGAPLAHVDVQVTIIGAAGVQRTKTDENGSFDLSGPLPGEYTLSVAALMRVRFEVFNGAQRTRKAGFQSYDCSERSAGRTGPPKQFTTGDAFGVATVAGCLSGTTNHEVLPLIQLLIGGHVLAGQPRGGES